MAELPFYVTAPGGSQRLIAASTRDEAVEQYKVWALAWYQPVCPVQFRNVKARAARAGDTDPLYRLQFNG